MTITMYGADWCGDCIRAKRFFAENEVEYTYVDLVESPEATKYVLERNGGVHKIPVIVFADDSHLTEPNDAELEAKLAELVGAVEVDDDYEVTENIASGQFELRDGGELLSFASYSMQGDAVVVPHVETLFEHRGQGNASRLMDGLLDLIRNDGRTITPYCPFAADHVRNNAKHHDLLTKA